tara:strand:- start:1205 stop:1693 length:489 start_codon:yes stop_codon:yes gene_type:complete
MKNTLYEISNDYLQLVNQLEELEGELTPEIEKALEINESNLKVKGKGYVEIIKTKDVVNMAIDIEIKRLQALKKQNNTSISFLKDRLLGAVELFGDIETGLVKIGKRKSESLLIIDAALIPTKYKVQVITEKVEKMEIKKAIKNGKEIEGVELVINQNLTIK